MDNNSFLHNFQQFVRTGGLKRAFNLDHLTPTERAHIVKVYALLCLGCLTVGAGVWSADTWLSFISPQLLGLLGGIGAIVGSAYVVAQRQQAVYTKDITPSVIGYEGTAFCIGLVFSQAVLFAAHFYTHILIQALLGSVAIFASLTLSALFAPRRSYLWLGGLMMTVVSYTLMAQFVNFFFRWQGMSNIVVISGLVTGAGFTLADTQMMLENAHYGDHTVVTDSLQLLQDYARLFINLLVLLLTRDTESDGRKRRRN